MQQTAEFEAANFVLKQENAVNAEAKAVLDSWVRHEQQVRESQQAQLVKTVQANVLKSISDPKFKKDLIASALNDIESESLLACFTRGWIGRRWEEGRSGEEELGGLGDLGWFGRGGRVEEGEQSRRATKTKAEVEVEALKKAREQS